MMHHMFCTSFLAEFFFGGACQCQLNFGVRQMACQTHFFPELLGMALCVLALF